MILTDADVTPEYLEERRSRGLDGRDEMWEGVLHMAPPPIGEHQSLASDVFGALLGPARRNGLIARFETGLFDPTIAAYFDYTVPDQIYADPSLASHRGIDGPADVVVEFGSPGDDTYKKFPFFHRIGVRMVVVIHPPQRRVEVYVPGPSRMTAVAPDPAGWFAIAALGVRMRQGVRPDGSPALDVDLSTHTEQL